MIYSKLRIAEKIVVARETISLALNEPVVSEAIARFGFSPERLSSGLSIQEEVELIENKRQAGYSDRIAATAAVDALYAAVTKDFQVDRRIVLAVAKNKPGYADRMRISVPIERRRDAFLFQLRAFYNQILGDSELRAELEPYSFTEAFIMERLANVNAYEAALEEQQRLSGISLVATKEREEAMANLDNFMAEFIGAARLAFRLDKRQLEKLGIR